MLSSATAAVHTEGSGTVTVTDVGQGLSHSAARRVDHEHEVEERIEDEMCVTERSPHDHERDELENGREQASSDGVNSLSGYVPFSAQHRCARGCATYMRVVEL
jgi:hypothetical protein